MREEDGPRRDLSLLDTIERLRAERYNHLDRELVLEILRLHGVGRTAEGLSRDVDEAIARRLGERA